MTDDTFAVLALLILAWAATSDLLARVNIDGPLVLLFADASRVNVGRLRRDVRFPARLLGIGLPLSVVLGSLLAAWLLNDLTWALAGFVGATLAPTDAAPSVQVINDSRIPMRVRRILNVESGLNDGIVTPIVAFMLAAAASQLGVAGDEHSGGGGALLGWPSALPSVLPSGGGAPSSSRSVRVGTGAPRVGDVWAPLPQR
jgi:NhaP-type Na+/H+ or K+/H+ antiporter